MSEMHINLLGIRVIGKMSEIIRGSQMQGYRGVLKVEIKV